MQKRLVFSADTRMTFGVFISEAFRLKLFEDTLAGDFIYDAACDSDFGSFKTEKAMVTYLESLNAVPEALEEGKLVFRIWKKTRGSMIFPKRQNHGKEI